MRKTSQKSRHETGFSIRVVFALAGLVIALAVAFAISGHSQASTTKANVPTYLRDTRFTSLTVGTIPMTEIPSVLPQGGVTINHQFILRPLMVAQSRGKFTTSQAIALGRKYANAHPFAASAMLASFTAIETVPPPGEKGNFHSVQNVASWIVTFTTNDPQNVIQGKKGSPTDSPKHFNVVLNASTGAFVFGFFTE